jgi:hypothetical protein
MVEKGRVQVSQDKIQAIMEKMLKNKKGVQQFLGMMNYHWHFIKDTHRLPDPSMTLLMMCHLSGRTRRRQPSRSSSKL